MIERVERDFERFGFGLWAVELPGEEPLIGFVGLMPVPDGMPFAPAVEVGWRLASRVLGARARDARGRGWRWLRLREARLPELVSYTSAANERSRRLMERLGMRRDPAGDFVHPLVPRPPAVPHVLYRLGGRERGSPSRS